MQICSQFYKTYIMGSCTALEIQKLENFRPRNIDTHCHAPPKMPAFTASISRANTRHPHQIMLSHTSRVATHLNCMTSWMMSDDLEISPESELPKKKKKKKREREREKMLWLWPRGPLTLTTNSEFSKRTCPTQFFEYITILGSISSFKTRKLCKHPISRKLTFS